ncbi:hypothetical protein [Mannheimia haemolytica]|uniref:hypothetical protein n=1 Tax=Mannheimia haemolytica TaxID=75985 RepID=UPI001F0B54D1|nr:hypothetical protein [Mannheimia haemolytica]UQX63994.1 hypothetical protein M3709_05955 [Mannheimia haemolytica]
MFRLIFDTHILNGKLSLFRVNCQIKSDLLQLHQNFYPDFIVELIDGRILIVEYKGEQLKSNEDSKEKALIGNLWEKLSQGKGLFIMAVKSDENGVEDQT